MEVCHCSAQCPDRITRIVVFHGRRKIEPKQCHKAFAEIKVLSESLWPREAIVTLNGRRGTTGLPVACIEDREQDHHGRERFRTRVIRVFDLRLLFLARIQNSKHTERFLELTTTLNRRYYAYSDVLLSRRVVF